MTVTTEIQSFIDAMRESPYDTNPRLIFADYIEEKGDEDWACLIRTMIELEKWPRKDLVKRKSKIKGRRRELWSPDGKVNISDCGRTMKRLRDSGVFTKVIETLGIHKTGCEGWPGPGWASKWSWRAGFPSGVSNVYWNLWLSISDNLLQILPGLDSVHFWNLPNVCLNVPDAKPYVHRGPTDTWGQFPNRTFNWDEIEVALKAEWKHVREWKRPRWTPLAYDNYPLPIQYANFAFTGRTLANTLAITSPSDWREFDVSSVVQEVRERFRALRQPNLDLAIAEEAGRRIAERIEEELLRDGSPMTTQPPLAPSRDRGNWGHMENWGHMVDLGYLTASSGFAWSDPLGSPTSVIQLPQPGDQFQVDEMRVQYVGETLFRVTESPNPSDIGKTARLVEGRMTIIEGGNNEVP